MKVTFKIESLQVEGSVGFDGVIESWNGKPEPHADPSAFAPAGVVMPPDADNRGTTNSWMGGQCPTMPCDVKCDQATVASQPASDAHYESQLKASLLRGELKSHINAIGDGKILAALLQLFQFLKSIGVLNAK